MADDEKLASLASYVNPGDTPEEAADRKARYKKLMDAAAKKTPWGNKGKWAKPDAAADAPAAPWGYGVVACLLADEGLSCLLGTFVENEIPYAPNITAAGSHLDVYLSQPAGAPGKAALQAFFEGEYGDVAAFDAAWGTSLADWAAFQQLTSLGDCPPAGGLADEAQGKCRSERRRNDETLIHG